VVSFAGAVLLDMAALRGEGVELETGDETGEEDSSSRRSGTDVGAGAGRRGLDLNARIGEFFSKLRAGVLTDAEATSLLRRAGAPSFFATRDGGAVLVWWARDVIGTWL
jgi:hypothetical protein